MDVGGLAALDRDYLGWRAWRGREETRCCARRFRTSLPVVVRGDTVESHLPGYRPRALGPLAGELAEADPG